MATVSPHVASLTTIVGRQAELRNLRAAFLSGSTVQVLTGMGGVGKTSVARAYAQRHLDDYGLIWWIRAEDPAAIDAEFRSLLEVLLPPGEAAKITNARTKAFALLATQDGPWLLVLDNVLNAQAVSGLLPPAGPGHVLITSRATDWPRSDTVRPLETDAAIGLLASESGDPDRSAARALAIELGHLPLALTHAAGFVRTTGTTLADYLRLFGDRSAELLDTVATTWRLTMDRLSHNAREILNVIAFYAPDAIPVHVLFASMDEVDRDLAIGELHAYSLVKPAAPRTVTVHRLVQAVTRNRLREGLDAHEWADRAHALITKAIPDEESRHNAATIAIWNMLHTHVLAVLDHLPPERHDALSTRNSLAFWTWQAGNTPRARDLFIELLPIRERALGVEHPDTMTTRTLAAHLIGWTGDPARARDMHAELLPIRERVLGVDHPDTLQSRKGVAWWTGVSGDEARARDLFAELVEVRERVLGADLVETLVERQNLAQWTGHAGDPSKARDMLAELLADRERVLGTDSPHSYTTRMHLAFWIGRAGDAIRAHDLTATLLPKLKQVLGSYHVETLLCRHNLAYWTGRIGDAVRARDMLAKLLPVSEGTLGAENWYTVATRRELGNFKFVSFFKKIFFF